MTGSNKNTRSVEILSFDIATKIAMAAVAAGRLVGVPVSVSVCDAFLTELVYLHVDGATPHSAITSRRKTQTAASTRRETGWMSPELAVELPLASGLMLTNIGGGVPINFNGTVVGALGVAGGTVQQDIEIAKAAIREIEAAL